MISTGLIAHRRSPANRGRAGLPIPTITGRAPARIEEERGLRQKTDIPLEIGSNRAGRGDS